MQGASAINFTTFYKLALEIYLAYKKLITHAKTESSTQSALVLRLAGDNKRLSLITVITGRCTNWHIIS